MLVICGPLKNGTKYGTAVQLVLALLGATSRLARLLPYNTKSGKSGQQLGSELAPHRLLFSILIKSGVARQT